MTNDKKEERELNALVAQNSEDRKGQEEFLAKVLMGLMIDRLGEGKPFPDEKVLEVIKTDCRGEDYASFQIRDRLFPLYIAVAKALLDDANYDLFDLRSEAIKFLRQEQPRTFKYRKVNVKQEV